MHILSTEARAAIKAIIVGDINDDDWRPDYLDTYITLSEHPTLSQAEIDAGIDEVFRLQTIDAELRADAMMNCWPGAGGDAIPCRGTVAAPAGTAR